MPSLRDWLTRKQRETRRGRAELRLAERAALWNAKPESRFLPAWWEWLSIRTLTRPRDWTAPQRKMMRKATRYHAVRGLMLAACLLLIGLGSWEGYGRLEARRLRAGLLEATTEDVPAIVRAMDPYRRWLDDSLREALAEAEAAGNPRKQLHASLALLPVDPGQVEYLVGRLLKGGPEEVLVLRESLRPHGEELSEQMWAVLQDRARDPSERLRAACALAAYTPDDGRWGKVTEDVAARLLAENAWQVGQWAEALRPVGLALLPPLAGLLLEEGRGPEQRRTLTRLYGGYAEGQPGFALLEKVLGEKNKPDATVPDNLALARKQANAAVALAAMGRWDTVTPLLRHSEDPTLRSYLIDQLGPGGAEVRALWDRLKQESEESVRRALLLALGDFDRDRLPVSERDQLTPRLAELYRDDPDPGMHSAAGWLLRKWGKQKQVEEIDQASRGRQSPVGRRWYVNGQGQTMVIVPTPGAFWMGEGKERQRRSINRSYAMGAREVTVEEFLHFRKEHSYAKQYSPTLDCPVNMVTWYDAAAYCNWLSKEEKIPEDQWCYVPNEKGKYAEGMKLAPEYLKRTGYRLPTEAEWEYACRAGSVTVWSHGEAEGLLPKYAWYLQNAQGKSLPTGLLRPNEFGFFDLIGNVGEWCQDQTGGIIEEEDKEDIKDKIDPNSGRFVRGGGYIFSGVYTRSSYRGHKYLMGSRNSGWGFRPARTFR